MRDWSASSPSGIARSKGCDSRLGGHSAMRWREIPTGLNRSHNVGNRNPSGLMAVQSIAVNG